MLARRERRQNHHYPVRSASGEGSPPRAEGAAGEAPPGTSPVNAYWWTRKVLAENEVDLDDDHDLDDGKSRV